MPRALSIVVNTYNPSWAVWFQIAMWSVLSLGLIAVLVIALMH